MRRVLGEQILVADPLITAEQVARLVSIQRTKVRLLADDGWLQRYASSAVQRCYKLVAVLSLLEPIACESAAELIGCPVDKVALPPGRPLRLIEAIQQQRRSDARWRRRVWPAAPFPVPVDDPVPVEELLQAAGLVADPPRATPIEPRLVEPYRVELAITADVDPAATVDVETAAMLLGLSRQQVRNLAASGQLAGEKIKRQWRLKLTHVIRLVNTRHAAAAMARAGN